MSQVIPGYTATETIDEGALHVIIRAKSEATGQSVIIKMLREDDADVSHGNRLRREFSVAKLIGSDHIIPVIELIEHRNSPYLVKMDLGGISLDRHLEQSPLSELDILRIGKSIAESIAVVHDAGVIHKDVKPPNIIVNVEDSTAWLTDFDISSNIKRERSVDINLDDFGGSLPYVSPEQTGRMNRSVDSRSDLYGLGVTLYEMCTGRRPFESLDPMEIVHGHIARTPTHPREINPKISATTNSIVMQLLAKAAEDRYQRAIGVAADLGLCIQQLETNGQIDEFELGSADIPATLQIPEKLYGRERETNALLDAYSRVSHGSMEVATVFGYSGVGKSSLVSELNKPITKNNGRFVVGKFEQFKRSSPYSALIQAFETLSRRMFTEDEETTNRWIEKIQELAGDSCAVIPEIIPALSRLFTDLPPAVDLGGLDAQLRQRASLAAIVRATATNERPMVLFLDDLQWADADTLAFLDHLAATPVPHLYLILSYRDNETPIGHPIHAVIARFEAEKIPVSTLEIKPLSKSVVQTLITDTVLRTGEDVNALASIVSAKTNGNPFFISQFLAALEDGNIFSVNGQGAWVWDLHEIDKLAVTENVVELLRRKLDSLPKEQQSILALAAAIGSSFEMSILARVVGSAKDAASLLWPQVMDGYLITEGPQTLDDALHDPGSIDRSLQSMTARFAHDKIREAALELLSETERTQAHFDVSEAILEMYDEDELYDHLFELAGHTIPSLSLHGTRPLLDRYINVTKRAGEKAMASSTFGAASSYFKTAIAAMGNNSWIDYPKERQAITLRLAESQWLDNAQDELELLLDDLEKRNLHRDGKVLVTTLRRRVAFAHVRIPESIAYALEGLALLGAVFPKKANKLHAAKELLRVHLMMRNRTPQSLADMPLATNPDALKIIDIIAEISEVAYYNDPDLFPLLLLKQMELTLKYGNHHSSASVFMGYGIIRVFALSDVDRSYDICRMAMSMPDRFNQRELRPKNELSYAYMVQHRKEHLDETYQHFHLGYRLGLETGMHSDVANSTIGLVYHALFQGRPVAQAAKDSNVYLNTLHSVKQQRNEEGQRLYQATLQALLDPTMPVTIDRDRYSTEDFVQRSKNSGDFTSIGSAGKNAAYVMLVFGQIVEARRYLDISLPYAHYLQGTISEAWFPFLDAIIDARLAGNSKVVSKRTARSKLKKAAKFIGKWATLSPTNYSHMVYLLNAEERWMAGKPDEAKTLFDRAVDSASRAGFVNCEAIAADCAAAMFDHLGDSERSMKYKLVAYQAYKRWGVAGRVAAFEREHPEMATTAQSRFSGSASTTTMASSGSHEHLDLGTVMKASHVIAAEIDQHRLMHTTLEIMVENAGADRGMLLSKINGVWEVSAHLDVNDSSSTRDLGFPATLISYVDRTRETLVLSHAPAHETFGDDQYIREAQPRSVLAVPVLHQSKLVGILYLENTLTNGAFTEDRIAILNLLTVQSAISLENAALYQNLEQKVEERTAELQEANALLNEERRKSEKLLLNILPSGIVERLKNGETTIADRSSDVSVLFADIANFTRLSSERSPEEVVSLLNNVFNTFDDLVDQAGLEKIKTIGDAYMVVSGLPDPREDHAYAIAELARNMQKAAPSFEGELGIRIGIHTGPVVAGVIGRSKFSYDIWGDTVNLAARMESHGSVGRIHVSSDFVDVLNKQSSGSWTVIERGNIEVKGKGKLKTYWIE